MHNFKQLVPDMAHKVSVLSRNRSVVLTVKRILVPVRTRYVPKGGCLSPGNGRLRICCSTYFRRQNGSCRIRDRPSNEAYDSVWYIYPHNTLLTAVSAQSTHRRSKRSQTRNSATSNRPSPALLPPLPPLEFSQAMYKLTPKPRV
jgi:hypothetical protein